MKAQTELASVIMGSLELSGQLNTWALGWIYIMAWVLWVVFGLPNCDQKSTNLSFPPISPCLFQNYYILQCILFYPHPHLSASNFKVQISKIKKSWSWYMYMQISLSNILPSSLNFTKKISWYNEGVLY